MIDDKNIYIKLLKNNISGIYKIIDCGFLKFFVINIINDFLKKNKIPNLESIVNYSDNIKHFSKIIKILSDIKNYKFKVNCTGKLSFTNLIDTYLPDILLELNLKKDIFEYDKNLTFYIKVYDTHTIAFIIDKLSKLIYYICTIENNSKLSEYIFFYIFELDDDYKIINQEKI